MSFKKLQFLHLLDLSVHSINNHVQILDKTPSIWDEYLHTQANRKFRYSLDMPMSVVKEYEQRGVKPRLIDMYKGMGVYEVPATAVAIDDVDYNFNGDIAADAYHKTDTDVKLLRELGVRFDNYACIHGISTFQLFQHDL